MKWGVLLGLMLCVSVVSGLPAIADIDGQLLSGQLVTISGSGFGVKDPVHPLIWDDFELGAAHLGEAVPPVNPEWVASSDSSLLYDDAWSHSGGTSVMASANAGYQNLYPVDYRSTDELYMSGWIYTQGWDASDISNTGLAVKFFRMNNMQFGAPPEYNGPLDHNFGHHQFSSDPNGFRTDTSFGLYLEPASDNSGGIGDDGYHGYTPWQFNGPPVRVEYFARLNTPGVADGYSFSRHIGLGEVVNNDLMQRLSGVTLQLDVPYFLLHASNAAADAEFYAWGDDFYADTTQARIEVCNVPWDQRVSSGAHCELQIPVSGWDDGTGGNIVFRFNAGSFQLNDEVYLYVIDSTGAVSDAFPMTIGASSVPVDRPMVDSLNESSLLDGLSVSISGSGFGVKDPVAPLRFDDFQNGNPTLPIAQRRYPGVDEGGVFDTQNQATDLRRTLHYSDGQVRFPGDVTLLQDYDVHIDGVIDGPSNNKALGVLADSYEWYATWWAYRDDWNGTAMRVTNTKIYGNFEGGTPGWTGLPESRWEQYFNGSPVESYPSGHMQMNDCNGNNVVNNWNGPYPELNHWIRVERYMNKSVDGYAYGKINQVLAGEISGNFNPCGVPFTGFIVGQYFRTEDGVGAQMNQYISEMYVDTTPARIELCNAASYSAATHCEIQLPKDVWDASTIHFVVRQGSFTDEQLWLFVIDANDVASNGFGPLSFDGLPSEPPLSIPGDLDGNGMVNLADLDAVSSLHDLLLLGRALLS